MVRLAVRHPVDSAGGRADCFVGSFILTPWAGSDWCVGNADMLRWCVALAYNGRNNGAAKLEPKEKSVKSGECYYNSGFDGGNGRAVLFLVSGLARNEESRRKRRHKQCWQQPAERAQHCNSADRRTKNVTHDPAVAVSRKIRQNANSKAAFIFRGNEAFSGMDFLTLVTMPQSNRSVSRPRQNKPTVMRTSTITVIPPILQIYSF